MSTTVVRYRTKPDRAAENQRLDDGVSFIHVVIEHEVDDPESLTDLPAFQSFVAGIADRCDVPPVASGASIVGGYR